jgi:hypothetical protein
MSAVLIIMAGVVFHLLALMVAALCGQQLDKGELDKAKATSIAAPFFSLLGTALVVLALQSGF